MRRKEALRLRQRRRVNARLFLVMQVKLSQANTLIAKVATKLG